MPTANATLLPPPHSHAPASASAQRDHRPSLDELAPGSVRHLEEIGVEAVLGAMIEQKRRSSHPSFQAIDLTMIRARTARDADGSTPRSPTRSDVFLKTR